MKENQVAVVQGGAAYNEDAPFHPAGGIPECSFPERSSANAAYESVRAAFVALGWDDTRFGTASWNPLGGIVRPGDTVLLKPNLVVDRHPRDPNGLRYTITHGSIVRAVADYVTIALQGKGRIIVADAPQTDSSFEQIAEASGLNALQSFYRERGIDFTVVDLRAEEWRNEGGVIVERLSLPGDPQGYSVADIGEHSAFYRHGGEGRYYGADYDTSFVNEQHRGSTHRYSMSNTALECDVFINLPKLKTHKKGGLTCSLKNLVGINGDKNYLPHHTVGSPENGGDQYPQGRTSNKVEHTVAASLRRLSLAVPVVGTPLLRTARSLGAKIFGTGTTAVRSGNWHGNDTVWRMTLDMNRILLWWNRTRKAVDPSQTRKRYLSVVDAVIAGEGNGPMDPDPRPIGIVIAGINPVAVDASAAVFMGFDPDRIPTVREGFQQHALQLLEGSWEDIEVKSNKAEWAGRLEDVETDAIEPFKPHFGWRGRIERRAKVAT